AGVPARRGADPGPLHRYQGAWAGAADSGGAEHDPGRPARHRDGRAAAGRDLARQRLGARERGGLFPRGRLGQVGAGSGELPAGHQPAGADPPAFGAGPARTGRDPVPARFDQPHPAGDAGRGHRSLGHQDHERRDQGRRPQRDDGARDRTPGRGRARTPRQGDPPPGRDAGRRQTARCRRDAVAAAAGPAAALPAELVGHVQQRQVLDHRVPAAAGSDQAADGGIPVEAGFGYNGLTHLARASSSMEAIPAAGSLVCVGLGMTLGSHLGPLARSHIEQADVVFAGLSDGIVELWLQRMHRDVRSLQVYYREGKSRMQTYREMVEAILTEVRAGKRVCGVFYGHPGVFAWAPHKAIEVARGEGYAAHMEPGISAEDCLYADLGIDPGRVGCQHYEASQLLFYRRRIDPTAYLVLWQVGLVGDQSLARFSTGPAYRQLLVEVLSRDYPPEHEVIIYRAPTLPIQQARIERLPLGELPQAEVGMADTVVVPPARALSVDHEMRARLDVLDKAASEAAGDAAASSLQGVKNQA